MSLALASALQTVIQENLLMRGYWDALLPNMLFRQMTTKEEWPASTGQTHIFTRTGLLPIKTRPRTPGVDPVPQNTAGIEQWSVTVAGYSETNDTHMPSSYVQMASEFLKNGKLLATQAAQTLNHLTRNKIYNPYLGGNTYATAGGVATVTVPVAQLNGFLEVMPANGRPTPVSNSNPLTATIAGVAGSVSIVAATPVSALDPLGAGTLTLSAPATFASGAAVLAYNRSKIIRAGGAATPLALTTANVITISHLREAVKYFRDNNVPTHSDGYYHMHCPPATELELFADTEFQSLYRGRAHDMDTDSATIAKLMGIHFIRNNECPTPRNTSIDDYVAADMVSTSGAEIYRPIITGGDVIIEKYVPQDAYLTNAGITGQLGDFSILAGGAGGLGAVLDGIRFMVRPPLNRTMDEVAQTFVWEGDFGIPSDQLTGSAHRYKRAVVIEHG